MNYWTKTEDEATVTYAYTGGAFTVKQLKGVTRGGTELHRGHWDGIIPREAWAELVADIRTYDKGDGK